jgi:predicted metalloprotease with PDZ domain
VSDSTPVRFHILPAKPQAHLFRVSCTVTEPAPSGQPFSMPAWTPGSYMVRDFARNVVSLAATAEGRPVAVEKTDKQTWQCAPCAGPLTVTYEVYAWELSVRTGHLDTTHAYFNGANVFLCPAGCERSEYLLEIERPFGESYGDWRVATAMSRAGAEPYGFGTYRAEDYEDLIDHPVEMGRFSRAGFEVRGIPHDIVISGRHRADLDRLCTDLGSICEQHVTLFGELPPIERYLFLITAVGEGYGGLEHRASCSLLCRRDDLPRSGVAAVGEGYRDFLGLCSHEYFHTWNVKRIRPAAFVPYDLSREVHTRLLWAFEGITSYYDELGLARAAVISPESYLELLGQTITRVWRGAGRFRQTLAESSFDAWTRFYKQDENAPNAIVSYYGKGAVVALALDLVIRRETHGSQSLDQVMRLLWERHGRTGLGVPEDGVEAIAAEVAGVSLGAFFDQAVRATEDLPLADLLADVGVTFQLRPAESQNDKGGKPATTDGPRITLGVRSKPSEGGSLLTHVLDGGAAQEAGLAAGDLVMAVGGLRITGDDLEKRIGACPAGERVTVHAFRRDELVAFEVAVRDAPADTCVLSLTPDVDPATLGRRQAWLAGSGPG